MSDIECVDALSYVRAHPKKFFPAGVPAPAELASVCVLQSSILGMTHIGIDQLYEWFVISTSENWITKGANITVERAFREIVPFPEYRQNSHRYAIFLKAFSENLAIYDEEVLVVNGTLPCVIRETLVNMGKGGYFVVAFN